MSISAELEWRGVRYELKYTFDIIRRIRAEGVNVPAIYRAISQDPKAGFDYGDDIAFVVAWLLREAGAPMVLDPKTNVPRPINDEDVWRECMDDQGTLTAVFALFRWVCNQHFATSEKAPPAKKELPKPTGKRRKLT